MATNEDFVATTVVCPGDPTEGAPCLSGILPRSIGRRNLPYIHDLLDHAHALAADDDWIGFLNSDIVPTQQFIDRIKASDKRFVMCNVTDTNKHGRSVRFRPARGGSIDGVFMRPATWGEIRATVPLLVLGSRAWDTAFVLWSFEHMDSSDWFQPGECAHVLHDSDHWTSEEDEASKINMNVLNLLGWGTSAATEMICEAKTVHTGNFRYRLRMKREQSRTRPERVRVCGRRR